MTKQEALSLLQGKWQSYDEKESFEIDDEIITLKDDEHYRLFYNDTCRKWSFGNHEPLSPQSFFSELSNSNVTILSYNEYNDMKCHVFTQELFGYAESSLYSKIE